MTGKHLTIGVAGHVDHGKSALVKALTGIETDRLKEEQERGMSIVLGFAHLDVSEGRIDIIDVPGHEKFLKTMISGATGIDAVLLVIAANEKIKPQTVEHLMLADLLGVRRGVIVVAKSDLIADDNRPGIENEIREFVQETFLADAPLIFVSAQTGDGIGALRAELEASLAQAQPRAVQPFFYFPIDRAFTMPGHGTVVTGTLRRGSLSSDQNVELLPSRRRVDVRGLEAHNQAVTRAEPGWRTAANLRGVKKEEIGPGAALATLGYLQPTRLIDTRLRLLSSASLSLKRGQTVRLHWGTTEALGRVYPLLIEDIAPGDSAYVQVRFVSDQFVPVHEPFIVRTVSPMETIGGGTVLDAHPRRRSVTDDSDLRLLPALEHEDIAAILGEKVRASGVAGRSRPALTRERGWTDDQVARVLTGLPVTHFGDLLIADESLDALEAQIEDRVRAFHASNPLLLGIPKQALRQQLSRDTIPVAFEHALEELTNTSVLVTESGLVRETSFDADAHFPPKLRETMRKLEERYRKGGLQPPDLKDVVAGDKTRQDAAQYLIARGRLLALDDCANDRTVIFHPAAVAQTARLLAKRMSRDGNTVSEINALLGTTRKYSIPLLEYLDALGKTRRTNDKRMWNKPQAEALKEQTLPAPNSGGARIARDKVYSPRIGGWGASDRNEPVDD